MIRFSIQRQSKRNFVTITIHSKCTVTTNFIYVYKESTCAQRKTDTETSFGVNNKICLGVRFALCIIKALRLAGVEHCSQGTAVTRFQVLHSLHKKYLHIVGRVHPNGHLHCMLHSPDFAQDWSRAYRWRQRCLPHGCLLSHRLWLEPLARSNIFLKEKSFCKSTLQGLFWRDELGSVARKKTIKTLLLQEEFHQS